MLSILKIVSGAPIWVWPLLAYLIFVGIRMSKQRIVYIPALFIVPAIFIALKLKACPLGVLINFIVISIFTTLSAVFGPKISVEAKEGLWAQVEGSWYYLTIFLTIFITRFFFGASRAILPEFYAQYGIFFVEEIFCKKRNTT